MPTPPNASEVLVESLIGIVSEHDNFELIAGVAGTRIWITKITISVITSVAKTVRIHFEDELVLNNMIEGGHMSGGNPIAVSYPHAIPGPIGKALQVDLATIGSTDISIHYMLEVVGVG